MHRVEPEVNAVGGLLHRLGPLDCEAGPSRLHQNQLILRDLEPPISLRHIRGIAYQRSCSHLQSAARLVGRGEEGAVRVSPQLSAPLGVLNFGLPLHLPPSRPTGDRRRHDRADNAYRRTQ